MRSQLNDVLYVEPTTKMGIEKKQQHESTRASIVNLLWLKVSTSILHMYRFAFLIVLNLNFLHLLLAAHFNSFCGGETREFPSIFVCPLLVSFPTQVSSFNACQIAFFRRLDLSVLFYAILVKINLNTYSVRIIFSSLRTRIASVRLDKLRALTRARRNIDFRVSFKLPKST